MGLSPQGTDVLWRSLSLAQLVSLSNEGQEGSAPVALDEVLALALNCGFSLADCVHHELSRQTSESLRVSDFLWGPLGPTKTDEVVTLAGSEHHNGIMV